MSSAATEPDLLPELPSARALCSRCRRPPIVCYCAALPSLSTRTKVVILQHPRERDMPIGTARMASLCLDGSSLHVGIRWDDSEELRSLLGDPARPPILLYPAAEAKDILSEPPPGPVTLVVVDGTWSQAKTVVRDNAILRGLPRYAFSAPEPSQYRIRREPSDEVVSTIEALMYCLGSLEGEPEKFRALLAPLHAMVDAQLAANRGTPRFRTRRRVPGPNGPRIPAAVRTRWEDLVCIVGEGNAWPFRDYDAVDGQGPRFPEEPVHFVAERVATGERLSILAAPTHPLAPSTTFHTYLSEEVLLAGGSQQALVDAATAFFRPGDIACGWGHHSLGMMAKAGAQLPGEYLDLRAALQRLRNVKIGTLEDVGQALAAERVARGPGEQAEERDDRVDGDAGAAAGGDERDVLGALGAGLPPAGPGRAGARLAVLAELLRSWRSQVDAAPATSVAVGSAAMP